MGQDTVPKLARNQLGLATVPLSLGDDLCVRSKQPEVATKRDDSALYGGLVVGADEMDFVSHFGKKRLIRNAMASKRPDDLGNVLDKVTACIGRPIHLEHVFRACDPDIPEFALSLGHEGLVFVDAYTDPVGDRTKLVNICVFEPITSASGQGRGEEEDDDRSAAELEAAAKLADQRARDQRRRARDMRRQARSGYDDADEKAAKEKAEKDSKKDDKKDKKKEEEEGVVIESQESCRWCCCGSCGRRAAVAVSISASSLPSTPKSKSSHGSSSSSSDSSSSSSSSDSDSGDELKKLKSALKMGYAKMRAEMKVQNKRRGSKFGKKMKKIKLKKKFKKSSGSSSSSSSSSSSDSDSSDHEKSTTDLVSEAVRGSPKASGVLFRRAKKSVKRVSKVTIPAALVAAAAGCKAVGDGIGVSRKHRRRKSKKAPAKEDKFVAGQFEEAFVLEDVFGQAEKVPLVCCVRTRLAASHVAAGGDAGDVGFLADDKSKQILYRASDVKDVAFNPSDDRGVALGSSSGGLALCLLKEKARVGTSEEVAVRCETGISLHDILRKKVEESKTSAMIFVDGGQFNASLLVVSRAGVQLWDTRRRKHVASLDVPFVAGDTTLIVTPLDISRFAVYDGASVHILNAVETELVLEYSHPAGDAVVKSGQFTGLPVGAVAAVSYEVDGGASFDMHDDGPDDFYVLVGVTAPAGGECGTLSWYCIQDKTYFGAFLPEATYVPLGVSVSQEYPMSFRLCGALVDLHTLGAGGNQFPSAASAMKRARLALSLCGTRRQIKFTS